MKAIIHLWCNEHKDTKLEGITQSFRTYFYCSKCKEIIATLVHHLSGSDMSVRLKGVIKK